MTVRLAALIGAAVLLAPGAAQACAAFQTSGSDLFLTYDPFRPSPIERTFSLRIQRLDPAAKSVRFILVDPDSQGGPTQIGEGPTGYDIRAVRDSSRPVLFQGAEQPNASNGLLTPFGEGAGGDVVLENLRLAIPAGRSSPAGDFFEPLEIRFVCERGDGGLETADFQYGSQVAIDLRVPELLSTYVGSMGMTRGQIAFGPLTSDGGLINRELAVTAQSTVPYSVRIRGQRGMLRRADDDDYGLAYSLRFAGLPIASGMSVDCGRSPAPSGRSHALEVGLDQRQVGRVPAGAYSDVITLSFSPRLDLAGGADGCAAGL